MASVLTRAITREKLASFLGNRQELIKLFENLLQDVGATIPNMVEENAEAAGSAQAAAVLASALATAAMNLAAQANEGPPPAPHPTPIPDDDGPPQLAALHARLATLELAVSQLSERPTP